MNCILRRKKKEYVPENPYVDADILRKIYMRFQNHDKIDLKDFKLIEHILSSLDMSNLLLDRFNLYEISSYKEYIKYFENKGGWLYDEKKMRATRVELKGHISGTISTLIKYLNNEI